MLIMSNPFRKFSYMKHRHLNHENLTLAAIDDIIARGGRSDWVRLRDSTADATVAAKVVSVCSAHAGDPYAQRYHLWRRYVRPTAA